MDDDLAEFLKPHIFDPSCNIRFEENSTKITVYWPNDPGKGKSVFLTSQNELVKKYT